MYVYPISVTHRIQCPTSGPLELKYFSHFFLTEEGRTCISVPVWHNIRSLGVQRGTGQVPYCEVWWKSA